MADENTELETLSADAGDELSQLTAQLNEGGSKLNTDGTIADVNDAPDGDEDEPVITPAPEPAATATPAPKEGDDDDEDEVPAGAAKPEANNFRINLKGASDKDRKTALVRLLKNEPGIDLDEAARRVGLTPAAVGAITNGNAAAENAPAATPDPLQALRDEIANLEKDEEQALTVDFEPGKALALGKQIRAKQQQLTKLEVRAEATAEVEQSRQVDSHETAVDATWNEVAKDFPDVGAVGTPLYNALQAQIAAKYKANPGFFNDPDWPTYLTAACSKKLGLLPKTAANAPAPVSQPAVSNPGATAPAPVTPRKTAAPAPAPGGSGSSQAQAAAVPQGDDPDDFIAFLNAHGSRG